MSESEYLSLWQFLRDIAAPEQTAEIDAYWIAHQSGDFYAGELAAALAELLAEYADDPFFAHRSPDDMDLLVRSKALLNRNKWKSEVENLLDHELPRRLKQVLPAEEYEVTARRLSDQQTVTLAPRDIAALSWIDIPNNQFSSSAAVYGEIAIRKIVNQNPAPPAGEAAEAPLSPPKPEEKKIASEQMVRDVASELAKVLGTKLTEKALKGVLTAAGYGRTPRQRQRDALQGLEHEGCYIPKPGPRGPRNR